MAKKRRPATLNKLVLERLMHYYRLVMDQIQEQPNGWVSSAQVAELLNMDDTLVRKDLAAIGVRGRPRVGFSASELLSAIRNTLGFNETYSGVIVGAGRLGGAIASYPGFHKYGLRIVALFDVDEKRTGESQGGIVIEPLDRLEAVIAEQAVPLAILTVPAEAAQELADRLVTAGVRAIWNFAPVSLDVPDHVFVRQEHISLGLAELAYFLKRHRLTNPAE
jgi:redox-sensing transcriptional repressor